MPARMPAGTRARPDIAEAVPVAIAGPRKGW